MRLPAALVLKLVVPRLNRGARPRPSVAIIAINKPVEDWGIILGNNVAVSLILDRFLEQIVIIPIAGMGGNLLRT